MPVLRLIAWNCHHGSIGARLAELEPFVPTIAFLQECRPKTDPRAAPSCLTLCVNRRKGIALSSLNAQYTLARLRARPTRGKAAIAATVNGPLTFTALGIWSRGPRYADDVMRTLAAYDRVLRSGPAVVMGDLNSGSNLAREEPLSKGHARILAALGGYGLVSAYHVFHQVAHGRERHPTYRHQRNRAKPWHIDFCFVPSDWNVVDVSVLDGNEWASRSDHFPLMVDIQVSGGNAVEELWPASSSATGARTARRGPIASRTR